MARQVSTEWRVLSPSAAGWKLTRVVSHTIGQAFANDPYVSLFGVRPKRSAQLFTAIAHLLLLKYGDSPCIYTSPRGDAVAVVTDSDFQMTNVRWVLFRSGFRFASFWLSQESIDAVWGWMRATMHTGDVLQDNGIQKYRKLIFLATDPCLQGQGLGQKLLAKITADADRAGIALFLEASATGVQRLYERFGFVRIGQLDVRGPGEPGVLEIPLMVRYPVRQQAA